MTAQARQGEHLNLGYLNSWRCVPTLTNGTGRTVWSLRRSAVRWKPIGGARSVQSVFWATPYRMLRKIKDQSNAPMNCTSVRAMVAKLRQDGFSAGEVEQGLPAILVDLYGER